MTEPGSFTDEQLNDFSNAPLSVLSPTSEKVLNTITPDINTRTLFKLNLTKSPFNTNRSFE